jgi:hypothetical protein
MVDAHHAIAITPETRWISRCMEEGSVSDGVVTPALIDQLLQCHKFRRLGLDREQLNTLLKTVSDLTYPSFVTTIFNFYGETQHKELVGDKTPAYVRSISTLHGLFPEAKFVHIIRDGRDVALSLINWAKSPRVVGDRFAAWFEDPLATAALYWEWTVRLGREAGLRLPDHLYHELRYESLVEQPAETSVALCQFLELPYDPAMLRFHVGRTRPSPGLDAKHAWLPVTAGLRDWRRQMPPEKLDRFEAVAGDLLDELGYPRAAKRVSASARLHATEVRGRVCAAGSSRVHPLPARWS